LYLIHMRVLVADHTLDRLPDRRARGAQIDNEGTRTA
jgi:hypothetical protein